MDDMLNLIERLENFKIENFDKDTAESAQHLIEDAMWALRKLYSYKVQPEPESLTPKMRQRLLNQNAAQRLELIKDCVVDWDGYRSAGGLGSLLNEIWTYSIVPCTEEACVLSLYEMYSDKQAYGNYAEERPVWIEYADNDELCAAIMLRPRELGKIESVHFYTSGAYHFITLAQCDYNKTWRVWDNKPNNKQRQENKWENQDD